MTDRVELTEDEAKVLTKAAKLLREAKRYWQDQPNAAAARSQANRLFAGVVAARVQALTAERDTLRIDLRTCERLSREAADAARAELAELKGNQRRCEEGHGPLLRENKTLSAELAAANARCADYENGISWGTSCISCAKTLDSSYAEHARAEALAARCAELEEQLTIAQRLAEDGLRHLPPYVDDGQGERDA